MRASFLLLGLLSACATQNHGIVPVEDGRTIYVEPPEDGGWDDPAAASSYRYIAGTIQDAINAANPGDTIIVQSGTFTEDITISDGVRVEGSGIGETFVEGTVAIDAATDANTGIARLTVINPAAPYTGTGIVITGGRAVVEDCEVLAWDIGIQTSNANDVVIQGNEVLFNNYGFWSDVTTNLVIQNNMFRSNAQAGITNYTSDGQVIFNTLVGNAFAASALFEYGGALQFGSGDTETVANNIVVNNFYGVNCLSCGDTFSNNLVWGNTTNYINDASQMGDDLNTDPQFANAGEFDYDLTVFSPGVDVANGAYPTALDHTGEARPSGAGYDVGWDEFTVSGYDLVVTEVMANATNESVLEFVELYNNGVAAVDLDGLVLSDGDEDDTLMVFAAGTTIVQPGEYAVVVDPDYDGSYNIPVGVTVVTTQDTEVGNGLTTADPITLYEPNGSTVISTFSYPKDPGDGVSSEMFSMPLGDTNGNWRFSVCPTGSSPGEVHCFPPSGDPAGLVITEVLANGWDEATDEYIELYNPTALVIDAANLVIDDGDSTDTLQGFANSATLIGPGEHALIVDPGYSYSYFLPNGVALLTTGDQSLGNGLATSDPVTLYQPDGYNIIDSFGFPANPGDGYSTEKVDYAGGDIAGNWADATLGCTRGRSPGRLNGAAGGICDQLLINEIMSNPLVEDTGEFVEIFNGGFDPVDLAGLLIADPTHTDTITDYLGGSTILDPGSFAVVVDAEYAGQYNIPVDALIVTTTDTTIGNGMAVLDEVSLWEGDYLIDAMNFPFNAGNGYSIERIWDRATDAAVNWVISPCPSGASPGDVNCAEGGTIGGSGTSTIEVVISEIMANALDEDTGEYIEIYNYGLVPVDLHLFVLWDGDALDQIFGYLIPDDAVLQPGEYAVILDNEYAFEYSIPVGALLLTTGDTTLGSGLATTDDVFFFEPDGSTLIDSFTSPTNPGNGISIEKEDLLGGDVLSNWRDAACGPTPGDVNCP